MYQVVERLGTLGVVAVIRGETARAAIEVSEALIEGGLEAIEVTFTTPDAGATLTELDKRYGGSILLGAGTITKADQVEEARSRNAAFLVSPGGDPDLVKTMLGTGIATIPGTLTPTEIQQALDLEAPAVKLFPGSLGGPDYLKALGGPFPETRFIPTGGVSEGNIGEWFAAGAYAVGAGGSLAPKRLESDSHRAEIVAGARRLTVKAKESRRVG